VKKIILLFVFIFPLLASSQIKNLCKDSRSNWKPLGPVGIFKGKQNYQGIVVSVESRNGKEIYAGSNSGGLYRTNDGIEWENLTDRTGLPGMGIQDIALGNQRQDLILLATGVSTYGRDYGQGIVYSTNGGENWTVVRQFNPGIVKQGLCKRALLHPKNDRIAFVSVGGEVWNTSGLGDEQAVWHKVFSLPTDGGIINEMKFHPNFSQNGILYVSSARGKVPSEVYRLDVNLESSKKITPPKAPKSFNADVAVCPEKPDRVYMIFNKPGSTFYFHVSEDRGETFAMNRSINAFGMGMAGFEIEVSPIQADRIYFGGISLHRMEGLTSKKLEKIQGTQHDDIRDIRIISRAGVDQLICGNDGGVSVNGQSGDGSWTHLVGVGLKGLNISQYYDIDVSDWDPTVFVGGLQDNGTIAWKKGTRPQHLYGGDGGSCNFEPGSSSELIASYNSGASPGALVKIDLLKNKTSSIWNTSYGSSIAPIEQAEYDDNKVLYAYAKQGNPAKYGLYEYDLSTNENRMLGSDGNKEVLAIANAPNNPSTIYYAIYDVTYGPDPEGILRRSDNMGKSWRDISSGLNGSKDNKISHIAISPTNDYDVWVSYQGFRDGQKVYRSTDGGSNWVNASNGLPNFPVNRLMIIPGSPERIFAATDYGIYTRTKESNWTCFSNGLPPTMVTDLEYSRCSNKLYAATFGRGIWESEYPFDVKPSQKIVQYSSNDTLSGNQFWDYNILVRKGAHLIIGGTSKSEIKVMPGQKITVENGGQVTFTNIDVAASCGGSWEIELLSSGFWGKSRSNKSVAVLGNQVKLLNLENKGQFPLLKKL